MLSTKIKVIVGPFFLFVCLCFPAAGFADGIVYNMRNDVQPVASPSNDLSYASGTTARRANSERVLNVYWTFTGLLNGREVKDRIVYRDYKSLSFPNSYSTLAPTWVNTRATGSNGEYFSQVQATGVGSVETWRCNYQIR